MPDIEQAREWSLQNLRQQFVNEALPIEEFERRVAAVLADDWQPNHGDDSIKAVYSGNEFPIARSA